VQKLNTVYHRCVAEGLG